jgi:hypothetical protein
LSIRVPPHNEHPKCFIQQFVTETSQGFGLTAEMRLVKDPLLLASNPQLQVRFGSENKYFNVLLDFVQKNSWISRINKEKKTIYFQN